MTDTTWQKKIDALLPFLDTFERSDFNCGEVPKASERSNPSVLVIPQFEYSDSVTAFVEALYDNDWVDLKFDWTKWQGTAQRYVDSPDLVNSADAATIQRLFTTHVRKDRFCDGHLAAMFRNGHIVALLRRLKQIRSEL